MHLRWRAPGLFSVFFFGNRAICGCKEITYPKYQKFSIVEKCISFDLIN